MFVAAGGGGGTAAVITSVFFCRGVYRLVFFVCVVVVVVEVGPEVDDILRGDVTRLKLCARTRRAGAGPCDSLLVACVDALHHVLRVLAP